MARSGRVWSASETTQAIPVALGSRAAESSSLPPRVIPAPLFEAQLQAKVLLEQAEQRAEQEYRRRIAEFEADVNARTAELLRDSEQRKAELLFRGITEQNAEQKRQADELLKLASVLAERLLGEQLRLDPLTIQSLAEEVLREARGAKKLTVWASPGDSATLRALENTFAPRVVAEIEVIEDPQLCPGDLIVSSELGRTDAKLKVRLEYLLEVLRQAERT